jgi:hypothetical protein
MAYPPKVGFITGQPQQYDIHSNFGMFPGERLLFHCEMKTGCCKLGDTYYTSVTDTRYVARREECICCGCCCKKPHTDHCIYLHDIAQLQEVRDNVCCIYGCGCCSCLCCCCQNLTSKRLQLRGAFGSQLIYINGTDKPDFEGMITEAIAQHKLPNRH